VTFLIDALTMSEWQDCRRRYVLSRDWRVIKWRPKSLFDACLRRAIVRMSQGKHVEEVSLDAKTQFMSAAANPGLDTGRGIDPYKTAMDYCAMLDTILRALTKSPLMTLHDVRDLQITDSLSWRTTAHADDSGTLHRWITCDDWGEGDIARELHSWYVMGDVCVNRVPMTLHVIEIGQVRNGRRASPWARAYKHPTMPGMHVRFRKTSGAEFGGEWRPLYLGDASNLLDVDTWVELMWKEGVAQERIHHLNVNCPGDAIYLSTSDQIIAEASAMQGVKGPWYSHPMSRNHCDTYVPCPFQDACYAEQPIDIRSLGLYQSRVREEVPAHAFD
jgi:hypothetical protein